jgi:hypothetical protein
VEQASLARPSVLALSERLGKVATNAADRPKAGIKTKPALVTAFSEPSWQREPRVTLLIGVLQAGVRSCLDFGDPFRGSLSFRRLGV